MTSNTFIAIAGGEVRAAVVIGHHEDALAEWGEDPRVEQIIRVPVEVARKFLFEKWPGMEAALEAVQSTRTEASA